MPDLDSAADVSHLGWGVDFVEHQPGVVTAEVVLHVILQLEAGDDALPLASDRSLEAAGSSPSVEPGMVYVPQILHMEMIRSYGTFNESLSYSIPLVGEPTQSAW